MLPENAKLTVTIKGDDSIYAEISDLVVPKIKETETKTNIVQETHMHVEGATTGSIIIHLCPLTDTAIERFFRHDGRVVQNMLKDLLLTARLQDILKINKEPEVSVKIRKKEQSQEEKGMINILFDIYIWNVCLFIHWIIRLDDSDTSNNVIEGKSLCKFTFKVLSMLQTSYLNKGYSVSYTHLTLPTICSV